MRYKKSAPSENIRDARGRGGGRAAAGGIGGLGLIGVILFLLFGGDPSTMSTTSVNTGGSAYQQDFEPDESTFDEESEQFMNAVLVDLEEFWDTTFDEYELAYKDPTFTFYDQRGVQSACGYATSAVGPHYCPLDDGIYLDLGFFDQLDRQFGAPGDAAQAYVVGHEFAHHVQNELGISEQVRSAQSRDPRNANSYSVALELQADCLAGVWLGSLAERTSGIDLERGDLDEALNAAAAVGDDRIQSQTTGRIEPHRWTHGSAEQRQKWFYAGFDSVDTEVCDTFGE